MSTKIAILDIERQSAIVEGVWALKQNGYLRTAQVLVPVRTVCLAWKWLDEPEVHFAAEWEDGKGGLVQPKPYKNTGLLEDYHEGHTRMMQQARDLLHQADYVIGWNSKPFDVPNMKSHILEHGINPPAPHIDVDLIKVSRSQFGFMSHRLNDVADLLGIGTKANSYGLWDKIRWSTGSELHSARAKMEEYNKQDVLLTEKVFHKFLPWIPGLNLYGMGDYDITSTAEQRCRRCNSPNITWEGTRRGATWWYRRFVCKDCGGYGKTARNFYSMETSSV